MVTPVEQAYLESVNMIKVELKKGKIMDYIMPNTFIIIKGQPKALQIERFQMGNNGVYDVKFKSSPRTYHYRYNDVVWLKDAVWHDRCGIRIFTGYLRILHNRC